MKILFFAQARLATNCGEYHLASTGSLDANELWNQLEIQFPALAPLRRTTRLARNCVYAAPDEIFQEGDEIALIPPVSGG